MTKNKSKDSKQQKQLKELAYQVQRFVNLKLNSPESAEEDHIPPALSPRPKSAKEGYQDALSGLTLLTPEQLSTMGFDVPTKSTPSGAAVEVKDPFFYQDPNSKLFLSEDGLAGAAVTGAA